MKLKPKMVAVFHTPTGRYHPGLKKEDGRRHRLGSDERKVVEDPFSIDAMGTYHPRYYQDVLSGTAGRR